MNLTTIRKLLSPEELNQQLPLSKAGFERIAKDTMEVKNILTGKDKRFLVIIGPCSAWPKEAVWEYAKKLKALESKVVDNLKIVMRVYIQKPRTARGWTGPINQPDPCAPPDIEAGIRYCRQMMIRIIELGLPIADEALVTHGARGFIELLSWVAIGARSTEDQEHRIFASATDCAAGIKNPTSGSLEIAVNSLIVAQHPHTAIFYDAEVRTRGNKFAHLVLRGGEKGSNYAPLHIKQAYKYMQENNIENPAIIIDASHENSKVNGKKFCKQQIAVVHEVMKSIKNEPELRKIVKGFMLESFIKEGSQKINSKHPENIDLGGLSLTDSCLGWKETEELLLELNEIQKKYGKS
ncbi:3-deoxy-7-phosphoheptulonate synthase [Candidatus Nomurabacteria bacterium RIFCSPHIGHO2_01_FULL_39_10]|uniref:Phospho-2-dehydro-3-deoxyheptonate aldolase n=1 Tax=Candidatus Nomurabacteria bacterium RIFCSPHIGHO2_01_FULL_39_10 TaxID=1801733 RepID=A0A1F6VAM1_9BACT|nr:MAG: 3-deoxy-7-phosphoheptulonate synthase [Candidatus Nomurabacteria bacterium RIFCSPHIGHO2_01_FULL_39_10]